MKGTIEVSIVLPCLNEAETIAICIRKARQSLDEMKISGEIVIGDNGSTDGSQGIAESLGARVIHVPNPGYGNALLGAFHASKGKFLIMGDADDSYSLDKLEAFILKLRSGADLVMGNRFAGNIEPGAMPLLHKYLGNPILSLVGRIFFRSKIRDFHCGLRGMNRKKILDLNLQTGGMEFASELIVKSILAGYVIEEVPTDLKKDGRSRPPHLRTWRDGWRHLRFLLSYSPRWLFLYPGVILLSLGTIGSVALLRGSIKIGSIEFGLQTLVISSGMLNLGLQLIWFAVLAKASSASRGFLPIDVRWKKLLLVLSRESLYFVYLLAGIFGFAIISLQFKHWANSKYGILDVHAAVRGAVYGFLLISLSIQSFFSQFLLSIVNMLYHPNKLNQR
jgi:glycosyltransferase involved in cell wall biosynthesis